MKRDEVPQDAAPAYEGQGKALYAVGDDGRMTTVRSAGWEAESIVLAQALAEVERLAREAHARVARGERAPLEYHMYAQRLDEAALAQAAGVFRWTLRRHLRADVWRTLSAARKARYAEVLGLTVTELETLPAASAAQASSQADARAASVGQVAGHDGAAS